MRQIITLLLTFVFPLTLLSDDLSPNEKQARSIFDKTYQMVFGPQGSTLSYSVNIIGIYKTNGTIWYKGTKSKFTDEKYVAWNDGKEYYRLERKKKTVTIYGANSEKRDKYATKFKFDPNNYQYSIKDEKEKGFAITLKAKKGVKGIKEARVMLDRTTHNPTSIRIKVGIFHTTIKISNFKLGGIEDNLFQFPHEQYTQCKYVDKR